MRLGSRVGRSPTTCRGRAKELAKGAVGLGDDGGEAAISEEVVGPPNAGRGCCRTCWLRSAPSHDGVTQRLEVAVRYDRGLLLLDLRGLTGRRSSLERLGSTQGGLGIWVVTPSTMRERGRRPPRQCSRTSRQPLP
ncbi:hypothetical protein NL676_023349 [Syzygium grande]|nr:hypothetical protein NL676_023349 [Syzygium grande]